MITLVCIGIALQLLQLVGIYVLLHQKPVSEVPATVGAAEVIPETPKDKPKPKKRPRTMTEVLNEAESKSREEAHR